MSFSTKKCGECGGDKSPSRFYRDMRNPDGLEHNCMDCSDAICRANARAKELASLKRDRERGRSEKRKAEAAQRRHRYAHKQTEYNSAWRKRNPEKYAAHVTLNNAVRDGKITKGVCEECGIDAVEAHHEDYTKPLEVRWLCAKHHGVTRRIDGDGDEDGR